MSGLLGRWDAEPIANGTVGLDLHKSNLFMVSVFYWEARGMDTAKEGRRGRRERKAHFSPRSLMPCRGLLTSASHFESTNWISKVEQCFDQLEHLFTNDCPIKSLEKMMAEWRQSCGKIAFMALFFCHKHLKLSMPFLYYSNQSLSKFQTLTRLIFYLVAVKSTRQLAQKALAENRILEVRLDRKTAVG